MAVAAGRRLLVALVVAADRHRQVDGLAIAPYFQALLAARRQIGHEARQVLRHLDLPVTETGYDIAGLDACLGGRCAVTHLGDQGTLRGRKANGFGNVRRYRLDRDAKVAVVDRTVLFQLGDDRLRLVRGDGEADADAATVRRIDGRVDADHLAGAVDQ